MTGIAGDVDDGVALENFGQMGVDDVFFESGPARPHLLQNTVD